MLLYGTNPLKEILENKPKLLIEVFIKEERHPELVQKLKDKKIKISEFVYLDEFDGINTQGIIFKIKAYNFLNLEELQFKLKDKEDAKIIILDQIYDPHNFGAIIRNAVAFDADAIIFSDIKNAPLNSTVVKASAGTWLNMNLCRTNSISNAINFLKKNEYWIVVTTMDGDKDIKFLGK